MGRTAPSDTGRRWLDLLEGRDEHPGATVEYLIAVLLSMMQLLIGSMDLLPQSSNECPPVLTSFCLFTGLFFSSSTVPVLSVSVAGRLGAEHNCLA